MNRIRPLLAAGLLAVMAIVAPLPELRAQIQPRASGSNIMEDDLPAVLRYLANRYRGSVASSSTFSGKAFTSAAAAALINNNLVSETAMANLQNDMAMVALAMQVREAAEQIGAEDPAAVQDAFAARAAAASAAAPNATAQATVWMTTKRAANDAIAAGAGVRDAARAVGGVKQLLELEGALQAVGSELDVRDPAVVRDLRANSPAAIVARETAAAFGLPPSFANRFAQDLLRDVATLQLVGSELDLRDPGVQRGIMRDGWRVTIFREALRGLGLPGNAPVAGADLQELMRQAGKIDLLGGDHSQVESYDVLRSMEMGGMGLAEGRARLQGIAGAAGGAGGNQAGVGTQPGAGSQPGNSNSNSNSSSSGNTPRGGGRPASDGPSSQGGQQGQGSQGSQQPSTPAEDPGTGGESDEGMQDGNVDMVVRVTHNSDGSYTATTMGCNSGGCESYGSETYTDSDGDGDYEGDKGGQTPSKPAEGDYNGDMDQDGDGVDYAYEPDNSTNSDSSNSNSGDDSDTASDDTANSNSGDDTSGSGSDVSFTPSDESRHRGNMWFGFDWVYLMSSLNGDAYTVLTNGLNPNGTVDTTPAPDGSNVGWTRPTGDVPIRQWFGGDPTEDMPPPPSGTPEPVANPRVGGQINPDRNGDGAGTGAGGGVLPGGSGPGGGMPGGSVPGGTIPSSGGSGSGGTAPRR